MKKNLIYLLSGISSISYAQQINKKPNLLFIFADDLTYEALCSKNKQIKIPNLTALQKQGTTFSHAYNQGSWSCAVSAASRTMLNTGMYLWKSGKYAPTWSRECTQQKNWPDPNIYNPKRSIPKYWSEYMREAGYETFFTGKWHVNVNANKVFDHVKHVRGGMPNQTKKRYNRLFLKNGKDNWSPYDKKNGGYWKGGKHWSEVVKEDAITFIDIAKNNKKPFFMYIAFNAVHDPKQSPKKYIDMYPIDKIKLPKAYQSTYPYEDSIGCGKWLRDEKLAPFPRTKYSVKVNRKEYYALFSHMDAQIGEIIKTLKKNNQWENTYIIFTADHGLALGNHGFMGKQNMYDCSMRVPFFIIGPDIKTNKKIDKMIYLQDAMATALDIADSKAEKQVDFKSILPMAKGQKTGYQGNKTIYGAYLGLQRMIRNERYKMILYPKLKMVRLYDLKKDPNELNDLAQKKKYKKVINQLFIEYKQQQIIMNDPLNIKPYYNSYMN